MLNNMLAPFLQPKHPVIMHQVLACKSLCWSILERAILDIFGIAAVEQHIRRDAITWLLQDDSEPYSYKWICEQLELNPIKTRQIIAEIKPRSICPASKQAATDYIWHQLQYYDGMQVHTRLGRIR